MNKQTDKRKRRPLSPRFKGIMSAMPAAALLPAERSLVDMLPYIGASVGVLIILGIVFIIRRAKNKKGDDNDMRSITLPAELENIEKATEFVNGVLEEAGCPAKAKMQIDVALDELMSNVANYAYTPGKGDITVSIKILEEPGRAEISVSDRGAPFNPLDREDPDVTLSAEERQVGGLGLFIVKKTMDSVAYNYMDGRNVTTVVKNL